MNDIKSYFKFEISNDYPNGIISVNLSKKEELKSNGWIFDNEDGYVSFTGVKFESLKVGFYGSIDNLNPYIRTPEIGYYSDIFAIDVPIKNQDDLNRFLNIIQNFIKISKIK